MPSAVHRCWLSAHHHVLLSSRLRRLRTTLSPLFTLTRLGMDARDTAALFALAGVLIVVVQGGLGRPLV
jgi:hypothetical protein